MSEQMRKNMDLYLAIVKRAQKMKVARGDQITQMIDIENAHKHFNLRLEDMLASDDFSFAHDFHGIQEHINRDTGVFDGCFLPRYSESKD